MKTFTVEDSIYDKTVTVWLSSFDELQRWVKGHYDVADLIEESYRGAYGLTMSLNGKPIVWFHDVRTSKLDRRRHVVHEVVHLARLILGHAGLELSEESEEAYAYYQTFLYTEIATRLGVA